MSGRLALVWVVLLVLLVAQALWALMGLGVPSGAPLQTVQ